MHGKNILDLFGDADPVIAHVVDAVHVRRNVGSSGFGRQVCLHGGINDGSAGTDPFFTKDPDGLEAFRYGGDLHDGIFAQQIYDRMRILYHAFRVGRNGLDKEFLLLTQDSADLFQHFDGITLYFGKDRRIGGDTVDGIKIDQTADFGYIRIINI